MSTTYTAFTTLPNQSKAEALGDTLETLDPAPIGTGVFEAEDGSGFWEVGGYFEHPPDDIGLTLLAAAHGAMAFLICELEQTDWVAKAHRQLHPVKAGRFFLHGSHDGDKIPDRCVPLLIEASTAFGTGHHETTRGCLLLFESLLAAGATPQHIADIGAGTAVLAMAAAKALPKAHVLGSDTDPIAVETGQKNIRKNHLTHRIKYVEAAGFEHLYIHENAPYDLIFSNILKAPLIALAFDFAEHLSANGYAILSGILNEQSAEIIAAYDAAGMRLCKQLSLGVWSSLLIEKPASSKDPS